MSLRHWGSLLGVVVLVLGISSSAQAQWGWGGGGYGFGGFGLVNGTYTLDPPPYFSLFPPVYYSHITPRPYGFSPYAYPGFVGTPERIDMPSVPFVPRRSQPAAKQPTSAQTAAKPVIIKNPYVASVDAQPERLADGRRLPQTVVLPTVETASKD